MSDNEEEFPGFIDDTPKKPAAKAPAPAASPAPAGKSAPGFNPFADVPVNTNAPAAKSAPSAPAPASEADIKPGSARDLWACPHCGAKNKPDRSTCRTCGKNPGEEVIVPWHQQPAAKFGMIGGGVVVFLLLLVTLFSGGLKLKPAGAEFVDEKVRFGGGASTTLDVGDKQFIARKQISVSGRIAGAGPCPVNENFTTVVLILGAKAKNDDQFNEIQANMNGSETTVTGDAKFVVMHLWKSEGDQPSYGRGEFLSLKGEAGAIEENGLVKAGAKDDPALAVRITEFKQ